MFIGGSKSSFKLFREFDMDRDGYLTKDDLSKALTKNAVCHTDKEVEAFFAFLDFNKKGCVSFSDFVKTMSAPEKARNISQPCPESHKEIKEKLQEANDRYQDINKGFDVSSQLRPKTRYGATPPSKSGEFLAPNPASSCYVSENDRLISKRLYPFSLAKEDKERNSQARSNRISYIQKTQSNFKELMQINEEKIAIREQHKVVSMHAAKEDYLNRVSMNMN